MASGIRASIFDAFRARLAAQCTWAKVVNWEQIRIAASDFEDHEIPAIQLWSPELFHEHQVQTLETTMSIFVEIIMRSQATGVVDQRELFDKIESVRSAIGTQTTLGISQMIHVLILGNEVDLHTLEPFYFGRIHFQAVYKEPYTSFCN